MERSGSGSGGMGQTELSEMTDALRDLGAEARDAISRLAEELELERRMQENPLAVLGVAAAAGFVLGGGLWPLLRPFVRVAVKSAMSPGNLLAIGAALGALRAAQGREAEEGPPAGEAH